MFKEIVIGYLQYICSSAARDQVIIHSRANVAVCVFPVLPCNLTNVSAIFIAHSTVYTRV